MSDETFKLWIGKERMGTHHLYRGAQQVIRRFLHKSLGERQENMELVRNAAAQLGKKELLHLLEFIERCRMVQTPEEFRRLLLSLHDIVPAEGIVSGLVRTDSNGNFKEIENVVNASFPYEWLSRYLENGYIHIDPIARNHFGRYLPQIWSDTFARAASDIEKAFVGEAKSFGLENGFTSGAKSARSMSASMFAFQGRELASHPRHAALLEYLTPYLHSSLASLSRYPSSSAVPLSDREIEVVQWLKAGKTNPEISATLHISERTVKFHIVNAMAKLGASTRAHLVAVALKEGIIEL
ncbi:MAG: LuxR family transcriptional regulator [Pseudomonadota bacterium]